LNFEICRVRGPGYRTTGAASPIDDYEWRLPSTIRHIEWIMPDDADTPDEIPGDGG